MGPMMVTIDRAGRIVVPKDVRHGLGLDADSELELTVEGDAIRLTPQRQRRNVVTGDDGLPVIEASGTQVTDADVQRWRDADQR